MENIKNRKIQRSNYDGKETKKKNKLHPVFTRKIVTRRNDLIERKFAYFIQQTARQNQLERRENYSKCGRKKYMNIYPSYYCRIPSTSLE